MREYTFFLAVKYGETFDAFKGNFMKKYLLQYLRRVFITSLENSATCYVKKGRAKYI